MTRHNDLGQRYLSFATQQARGSSPSLERWARDVAGDEEILACLATLPAAKQQPNLVFAAARWNGAVPGDGASLRHHLLDDWSAVRTTILARGTQTNEPARCAVLLPFLSAIPGPVALIEVGAAAGLCLYPDRYSYQYATGQRIDPIEGPSRVVIDCEVEGSMPAPLRMPRLVWRAGIDLHPLDPADPDTAAWLSTLVWPEQEARRRRLTAALDIAAEKPADIVEGDLNDRLGELVSQAPAHATLVITHSAVLAYLDDAQREQFVAQVRHGPGYWVSNEARGVVPGIADPDIPLTPDTLFLVAVDGVLKAVANGHGGRMTLLDPS